MVDVASRLRIDLTMNTENRTPDEGTATVWTYVIGVHARAVLFYLAFGAAASLQSRYDFQETLLFVVFAGILAFLAAIDFAWFGFHVSMRSWTTLYLLALFATTCYHLYSDFSLDSISIGLVFASIVAIPIAVGAGVGCSATRIAQRFQTMQQQEACRRIDPLDDKLPMDGST